MDLVSDFIFDDMCEEYWPVIDWLLEECDDVKDEEIPQLLTEDEDVTLEQAERIYSAYKLNHDQHCTHA